MSESPLDLVVAFVNTLDLETGSDEVATPQDLESWLRSAGVLEPGARVERPDVRRAAAVREAVRAQLAANGGAPPPPEAVTTLNRQARRSGVALTFSQDGATLGSPVRGVDRALGTIIAAIGVAMVDGSWGRLKVCRADDCRWAFVDRSRNGSRHWCSMEVCGNREKVRAFRARAAGA